MMQRIDYGNVAPDQQRLDALPVWRESPLFSDRERAALEWTEALTRVAETGVADGLFRLLREEFSEKDLVDLTVAVVTINGWNRLAIPFRPAVGRQDAGARAETGNSGA